MIDLTRTGWRPRFFITGFAAAFALFALAAAPPAAQARVWVSAGWPYSGYYYGPGPYYGYYPQPNYYAPPSAYYAPPDAYPAGQAPPAYSPQPAPSAYTPQTAPTPSAYSPEATGTAPPSLVPNAVHTTTTPKVTYTNKPAFTNSAGQTCREYKTTDNTAGRPVDVFGTACKETDGQWRVVN